MSPELPWASSLEVGWLWPLSSTIILRLERRRLGRLSWASGLVMRPSSHVVRLSFSPLFTSCWRALVISPNHCVSLANCASFVTSFSQHRIRWRRTPVLVRVNFPLIAWNFAIARNRHNRGGVVPCCSRRPSPSTTTCAALKAVLRKPRQ